MQIFMTNRDQQQPRRGGCLRGCLIALAIYFVCSFICGLILGDMFSSPKVKLEDYSIYNLELDGTLVEQGQDSNPFADVMKDLPMYGDQVETTGLDQILDNIRLAEQDDKIKGIYLHGGTMSMAPASAKAIRDRLQLFKQRSGKWIIAYADDYNATNYYVATVADKIYLNFTGHIGWHGTVAQKMYYTRLMEKVGVEMQILKVGTYKSAVEPFFRTSMSEADRQQTKLYLQGIWDEYRQAVSAARGISEADLDRYADEFIELENAERFAACQMVDSVVYREDMDEILRIMSGSKDYKLMSTAKLANVERPKAKTKERVAVLYAEGTINADGGDGITAEGILKQIKKIKKDDQVKAVVFRVNSPGGSADASEEIWHGVKDLQAKGLPVVVSMGDYAASGGYYISCAADYIYAEPTTLTGSIGIFGTIPNVKKLREKIGLDMDEVGTHKHSGLNASIIFNGMNKEEQAMMQAMIERGYDLFTRRCADGRKTTQDEIKKIAEGRVWLGKDAIGIGLVDSLGNISDAITKAAELAGIESYDINYYPEKKDPLEEMIKMLSGEDTEEERLIARIKTFAKEPRVLMLMEPVVFK
jgi:protease-4